MANTRELRRRIRSVKNTAQITKAMQMVAATKMRRAQNQALMGRPYSINLSYALSQLEGKIKPETHPFLQTNESSKIAVLLLSTDKALCGALNTNLFRLIQANETLKGKDVTFYTVGKKGRNFVVKTGKELVADFENPETVTFKEARQAAKSLIDAFLAGEIKEVYLMFPNFVSTLRQEPSLVKLLPIDASVIASAAKQSSSDSTSTKIATSTTSSRNGGQSEFLFEPNADELLDFVLNHHIETQIYQALLETKASEHSARMMAMQNATDNAKELVQDLNLTYNQTRQDAITRELLEITTAALALE